jgi:hypothetical protein
MIVDQILSCSLQNFCLHSALVQINHAKYGMLNYYIVVSFGVAYSLAWLHNAHFSVKVPSFLLLHHYIFVHQATVYRYTDVQENQ